MKKPLIALGMIALFLMTAAVSAQERGSVRGVVKDQDGNAIQGATATIAGAFLPRGREFVTGRDGIFLFQALPPGNYTLLIIHPQMMDYTSDVIVALDRQTAVNVTMSAVGRVQEEITVMAASPIVDLKSTSISASWHKDLVEKLPMGRSYASLFQLAPGVADNRDFAPNAGGNKQDNVYLYDGSNITNPLFGYLGANFSELDIQEVNIKRGGVTAEFGRAAGMVTNAVTKSGSNTVSGSMRFIFEPAAFTAGFVDPNIVTKYNQYQPAVGVGGPLVKDKLFWYVSGNLPYSLTTGRVNNLGSVPDSKRTSNEFFGKITANPHKAHTITLSIRNNDYKNRDAGIGVNDHPSAAYDSEGLNRIIYGSWVWTISQNTILETRYNHVNEDYSAVPITDLGYRPAFDINNLPAMGYFRTATGYIVGGATASGQFVGGYSMKDTQNFFRDELKFVLSHYADFRGHSHVLKAGFSYDDGGEYLDRIANGWGSITVTTYGGQPVFRAAYYSEQAPQDSRGRTYSIFIQDTATIGERLTLTAGLLFNRDEFSAKTAAEKNTFLRFSFEQEVQPRIGLAFTLDPKAGDKIYANWGRYNNMDNRSLSRAAAPIRIFLSDAYFLRSDGSLIADLPRTAETGKVILPGLKPTYTDEVVGGYSRPLGRVWSIDVWGQYRTMKNVIEDFPTRNRETSPSQYVYANLNGQTISYGGNPAFEAGKARRVYKAASFELKKQYADRWSMTFMYTWSRLEGNWDLDYAASALFYASSALEDGPGLYVSDPNRDGLLIGHRTHVLKFFGSWEFYKNFTLGWFSRIQSGRPWESRGLDYVNSYRRYLEPAGSNTLKDWGNLDLQVSYAIPIGRTFHGIIEARIMNLFNDQTALTIDQRADQPTFKNPTSYAPPRKFALSFHLNF